MTKEDKQLHALFAAHAFGALLSDEAAHAESAAMTAWHYADKMMNARDRHFAIIHEDQAALDRPMEDVTKLAQGDILLCRFRKTKEFGRYKYIYIISTMGNNVTFSRSGFSAPLDEQIQLTTNGFAETMSETEYFYFKRNAHA